MGEFDRAIYGIYGDEEPYCQNAMSVNWCRLFDKHWSVAIVCHYLQLCLPPWGSLHVYVLTEAHGKSSVKKLLWQKLLVIPWHPQWNISCQHKTYTHTGFEEETVTSSAHILDCSTFHVPFPLLSCQWTTVALNTKPGDFFHCHLLWFIWR